MFRKVSLRWCWAVVAVSLALPGAAFAQSTSVKIAAPFGLTGPEGPFARPYIAALDLAVKYINDNGGIRSLGGAKLELLLQDSQSDPKNATRLLREMKAQGAVIAVAPFASGLVLAAKPVLTELNLPIVVPSLARQITEGNSDHIVWRVSNTDAAMVSDAMDFLDKAIHQQAVKVQSIGIVAQAGGAGAPFAQAIEARAAKMGISVVNLSYDATQAKNFGPIVAKLAAANVDLVTGFMYTADALQFADAYFLQNWRPSEGFLWMAGALGEYGLRTSLKADSARWMVAGFAATSSLNASANCSVLKKLAADYEVSQKEPLTGLVVAAPATVAVIADALERAGSTDPAAIKRALAATDIGYCQHPLYALAGGVHFNANGDNERFVPTIIQHEGETGLVAVWPEPVAVRAPLWPAR